jgi:Spore Coat Protein U domain
MKRILILAAMASVSTSAFAAPSDRQSVAVTATVATECSIGDPADVNFSSVIIDQNAGAGALLINSTSSGGTQNNNQDVWISCNYGAKTTISSANGGLLNPELNDGADATDFTNLIEYRISLTPSTPNAFLTHHLITAQGTTSSRANSDAFHDNANLRVYIANIDNTRRPLAGTYSDVATLAVGPV